MPEQYALVGPDNAVVRIEPAHHIDPTVPTRQGWRWLPVEVDAEPASTALQAVQVDEVVEANRLRRRKQVISKSRAEQQAAVNAERDRRLERFPFGNRVYDFDERSALNITVAGTLALAAIINGAQPGNLRWADPNNDFKWLTVGNQYVTMDAQTCLAFAQAAAAWRAGHIHVARALKDADPIPSDYAANERWPA